MGIINENGQKDGKKIYIMNKFRLKIPILFLIFNRPDTTQRVFEEIRKAKPEKLFVSADGPRENKPGENEKCRAVRDILKQVDWDCELITNFRDKNLGCRLAVSSGINWFFENVEEGIILEDDTLPHPAFFRFCEELLEKYRDDERVMMISGDNFQSGRKRTNYSYYFSRYTHIWGWASWRRVWKHYDVSMKLWPEIRDGKWIFDIFGDKKMADYWTNIFEKVYKNKIDTWDYQWNFACWLQNGLAVMPNINMVSNIGMDESATHTKDKSKYANMKTESMHFPVVHTPYILRDLSADAYTEKNMFTAPPFVNRAINKAKRLLK